MKDGKTFYPKSFAVIGAGPSGCILAAFLANGGYDVVLCDIVPELIEPALDRGIILDGVEMLQQSVSGICCSIEDLVEVDPDVIFVATKVNALPVVAEMLKKISTIKSSYVVSWQNGIDTELELSKQLGKEVVMRAIVNYGCVLKGPAHVYVAFHHSPHYLQELSVTSRSVAADISSLLTDIGLSTHHTDDITTFTWRKAILNASMNPVCAVTGLTMYQAMRDPYVFAVVDSLVKECITIARANEIKLGKCYYADAVEYMRNAGDHKPSMLLDIENGRCTEIDSMNGKFEQYGLDVGIKTPYNTILRSLVKGLELQEKLSK